MNDKARLEALEAVLAQMLKPVKDIPFNVIIRSLSDRRVIKFDKGNKQDALVLDLLEKAIMRCAEDVVKKPIRRSRPNEVGNDIEEYVMRALNFVGLRAIRPTSTTGQAKATGYPDILLFDRDDRPTYLECKIFAYGKDPTTMRSFYLSPSESFKVALDARHLLLAYGMDATPVSGSRDSIYRPKSFKLVDLYDLLCDVKYEFNSDNKRLYSPSLLLLEGML